jgi:DNA-binding IclR family transcriptional regulator
MEVWIAVASQSSDRLMSIIESFLTSPQQSLSEVAVACDLEPPTAIRYLRQLVERGWLERDGTTKSYTLGVALVTIGAAAQSMRPVRVRALPYMRDVLRAFDETVNIAINQRGRVVVIEALESGRSIRRGATVGQKDEWFVSSLGKSILAYLPESEVLELLELYPPVRRTEKTLLTRRDILADLAEIRERGYALDDEESEIGLKCVGVPIWGGGNGVNYALSVSGPTPRIEERLDEIIRSLKDAAAAISLANKGVPL